MELLGRGKSVWAKEITERLFAQMTKIAFMWLYLAGDHGDDKERVAARFGEEEKRWRAKVRLEVASVFSQFAI